MKSRKSRFRSPQRLIQIKQSVAIVQHAVDNVVELAQGSVSGVRERPACRCWHISGRSERRCSYCSLSRTIAFRGRQSLNRRRPIAQRYAFTPIANGRSELSSIPGRRQSLPSHPRSRSPMSRCRQTSPNCLLTGWITRQSQMRSQCCRVRTHVRLNPSIASDNRRYQASPPGRDDTSSRRCF